MRKAGREVGLAFFDKLMHNRSRFCRWSLLFMKKLLYLHRNSAQAVGSKPHCSFEKGGSTAGFPDTGIFQKYIF